MELWLIEAAGKRRSLESALYKMGRHATVYAVSGYVAGYKDGFGLGIARDLSEPGRSWTDPSMPDRIVEMTRGVEIIHIATDADNAGEVIACDLYDMLNARLRNRSVRIDRIRMRGIDPVSIGIALEQAGSVRPAAAAVGRAKAIVDRLISATFSRKGATVGRVATGMLVAVDTESDVALARRYTIVAPAADGGLPFFVETGPDRDVSAAILDHLLHKPPRRVRPGDHVHYSFQGWNFGDALIGLSDIASKGDSPMSIGILAKNCQLLYTSGRLSYPRSKMRGFAPHVVQQIAMTIQKDYIGQDVVPNPGASNKTSAHDSLHAIGPVSDTVMPGLATPEGILRAVEDSAARATNLWPGRTPDKADLEKALMESGLNPAAARILARKKWIRWEGVPPPGCRKVVSGSIFIREADAVLLDILIKNSIGTPSSWPELVANTMKSENAMVRITEEGKLVLTEIGSASLEAAPGFMRDPGFSQTVTMAMEEAKVDPKDPAPWRSVAVQTMAFMPEQAKIAIRNTLLAANRVSAPRSVSAVDMGISDANPGQTSRYEPTPAPQPVPQPMPRP